MHPSGARDSKTCDPVCRWPPRISIRHPRNWIPPWVRCTTRHTSLPGAVRHGRAA
jgi:hypothetical protein